MIATNALLEFPELLKKIPILQTVQRCTPENKLAMTIKTMTGHTILPVKLIARNSIPAKRADMANRGKPVKIVNCLSNLLRR